MAEWVIDIPCRAKAVQSVRGGRFGFYPDRKVREWKESIIPFIRAACGDRKPTAELIRIRRLTYYFQVPSGSRKELLRRVGAGETVPYVGTCDITDNLAKGLIDCCAGLVFENDRQIWRMDNVSKVYGLVDGIHVEFEEAAQ